MNELICGLTPDQIQQLKVKHGGIFLVTVSDEAGEYQAICKEPSQEGYQAFQSIGKTDEVKGVVTLYDNCVLAKDEAIDRRFLLRMQVAVAISERINKLKASSKNL